jgi:hypothetical protein
MTRGPQQKERVMTKTLHSLLEMAIVVGGLAGTPLVVVASLGTIIAAVQTEPAATVVQEASSPTLPEVKARF